MNYVGIESIKQAYAQKLMDNGNTKKSLNVYNKNFTDPVYEGMAFHAEVEPTKEIINTSITEASIDFLALQKELISLSEDYINLVNNMNTRLTAIDEIIAAEEDRICDINAICGTYEGFDTIALIGNGNVSGTFTWQNHCFTGARKTDQKIIAPLRVIDVQGNGIEGQLISDNNNANYRSHITDNDSLTTYEYSRYTGQKKISGYPEINIDNEEARCTITLINDGNKEFNALKISSPEEVVVEDVLTSNDKGITYTSCLPGEIHLNNKNKKYSDPEYIHDSGIVALPKTNYAKIRLRSNGIASAETILGNDENTPSNVFCKHIVINNIEADASTYGDAVFTTQNLINNSAAGITSIAIFANEYVPSNFPEGDYFIYTLTVNGKDYNVVPINSHRKGTKVIRFSGYATGDNYIEHIKETIKSAQLKVQIKSSNGATPYLSNLKICYGKKE